MKRLLSLFGSRSQPVNTSTQSPGPLGTASGKSEIVEATVTAITPATLNNIQGHNVTLTTEDGPNLHGFLTAGKSDTALNEGDRIQATTQHMFDSNGIPYLAIHKIEPAIHHEQPKPEDIGMPPPQATYIA